jgi:hypothetical protein
MVKQKEKSKKKKAKGKEHRAWSRGFTPCFLLFAFCSLPSAVA